MTSIYFAFIVLPVLFMIILAFIFSSSVSAINTQQLKLNCPYPISGGVATNVNSDGIRVTYNVTYDTSATDYHLTTFHCAEDNPTSVTTTVYTTANNWFNVGLGYYAYIANTITSFFTKVLALGVLIGLLINAPAQVTGLVWFTYVNIVLLSFIAIGIFMVVRG